MKVALIIERIETWRGGAETSTMQFAEHLADLGCQVSILTTTVSPSLPGLEVVPVRASGRLRTLRTLMFSRRAAELVRAGGYDVAHCITPCPVADVYQPRGGTLPETLERNALIRTRAVDRAFKRLNQALNLKYRLLLNMESRLLNRVPPPYVIAISEYVARQLERHYRFDPSRIVHIFNGIDPDTAPTEDRVQDRVQVRRQYGLRFDECLGLCVAHNFRLKGVDKLIEALARPASKAPRVLVVGRDNPRPYSALAERLGVSDRVIFAGPTQRIAAFLHAADFLVHPTWYDPCSRVVLEALAAGLPVITTRLNGAAERVTPGVHGYVVESPRDVDGLAGHIGRLCDPEHRRACAAAAPAAVAGISMRRHAESVMDLYQRIVRERRGS